MNFFEGLKSAALTSSAMRCETLIQSSSESAADGHSPLTQARYKEELGWAKIRLGLGMLGMLGTAETSPVARAQHPDEVMPWNEGPAIPETAARRQAALKQAQARALPSI